MFTSDMLVNRLSDFANKSRSLGILIPTNSYNNIYKNQLIRASSSPGANYIEAIEASSSKEFRLRLKICRKEVKEAKYWINLIKSSNRSNTLLLKRANILIRETIELVKIFTASIITSEKNEKIRKAVK